MFDTPLGVSVVDGGGETPGPIPNPEAKPARADGTAPGREWESRLPPTQQLHNNREPGTWKHNPGTGFAAFLDLDRVYTTSDWAAKWRACPLNGSSNAISIDFNRIGTL